MSQKPVKIQGLEGLEGMEAGLSDGRNTAEAAAVVAGVHRPLPAAGAQPICDKPCLLASPPPLAAGGAVSQSE